uniref:asparagine synthase (glutamine-hydrolyzing) n=1 Tax=viral metagenome TaxID=1070528 RepID=A0A6C0DMF0_9ZZZZ
MCGIFTLLNHVDTLHMSFIEEQFNKGKGRGPEFSTLKTVMIKALFGFHRLAINGLNEGANQPIIIGDIGLICNGEIYNYKELYKHMPDVQPTTESDCEVILHLYRKYGIEHTLDILDGVFSFVLIDYRLSMTESKIYVARDPYGVRPLYMMKQIGVEREEIDNNRPPIYGFASELKMLTEITKSLNEVYPVRKTRKSERTSNSYSIIQFQPGTYSVFDLSYKVSASWKPVQQNVVYHRIGFQLQLLNNTMDNNKQWYMDTVYDHIRYFLTRAVEKRCQTTERPIACLLSGGLDSSLIAALVNDYHTTHGLPALETYSIGLEGSEDLKYARIVADYLGTKHTEIILSEQDFLNAIPEVIYAIESYDTTSVRASIGNYLLGKYISKHSSAKVIFNGDGSDELAGGYLYMNCAPDAIEFDKECRRLLKDIHAFDVLRSDKSISTHGLEPRTPFLDRYWVQFYMSLPAEVRFHKTTGNMEKYLIRTAFDGAQILNSKGTPYLPEEVLWRRKEAFSDGVSKKTRSLYEILQEFALKQFEENDAGRFSYVSRPETMFQHIALLNADMHCEKDHLSPKTAEQYYYRKLFESYYYGMGNVVPYFWMPKYIEATDASARTLPIYNVSSTTTSSV